MSKVSGSSVATLAPSKGAPAAGENAAVEAESAGSKKHRPIWTPARADFVALAVYLLGALYVTAKMWRRIDGYVLKTNPTDQLQFEYFLQHAARVLTRGEDPFFTDRLNAPDGVNLMANTSTLGLQLPLAPVTLLFGQEVSFTVMVTLSMFATAAAWYWLFSRHLVRSRFAALVAAGFCGFAPGMISQANGHPNISNQMLVPFILWCGFRLPEPGRALRNGLVLGLLITYQAFINEEVLLFTAVAAGVFVIVWAAHNRADARAAVPTFLRGIAVAAAVSVVLLAYPLYRQFFGRQSYHGLWDGTELFGTTIMSLFAFSGESLAGHSATAGRLSMNPSEQNAFFGWPLVVLTVVLAVRFWGRPVVRATIAATGLLALLSFGPKLRITGPLTDIPGPYAPFANLPLFDSVITTRLTLALIPAIALLLALWLDWVLEDLRGSREEMLRSRLVGIGLVVAALLPIAPTPLPITHRTPTPVFFTSGEWRSFVTEGKSVVTVPLTSFANAMQGMQWSADQRNDFKIAGGYFLGPDPAHEDGRAMFGPPWRPTSLLWHEIGHDGRVPAISDTDRANAINDLRYWRAAVVVLPPRRFDEQLRDATTQLLGFQPQFVGGVWVWDVRSITG